MRRQRHSCRLPLLLLAASLPVGLAPVAAAAAEIRLELGIGWAHGDHDLRFAPSLPGVDLTIESESALNGAGPAFAAGLWIDELLGRDIALGLEYVRMKNDGTLALTADARAERVTVAADAALEIDALLLNLAWRRNEGRLHPYAGLGAGVTRLAGTIEAALDSSIGPLPEGALGRFSDRDYAPVGQILLGFDIDLGERFYVGAGARYFFFEGRLFGREEAIRELAATAKIGLRF